MSDTLTNLTVSTIERTGLGHLHIAEAIPIRPDISVLIPVHNNPYTLKRAVRSVLEQVGVDVQVVICDDASTDQGRTQSAIMGLVYGKQVVMDVLDTNIEARRDERIVAVQRAENGRIAATLNMAAELAQGQYIIRLDSDDWFASGCLVRMKAALDANPKVGFVYGQRKYYGRRSDTYTPEPFERDQFNEYNAAGYCYLFRREVWDMGVRWEALGTFGGAVIDLEDWQHIHKMLKAGFEGLAMPDTLVLHYTFGYSGTWQELKDNEAEALAELRRRFPGVRAESL